MKVGEVRAFPVDAGTRLKEVYGFLQEISLEEYESKITALEKEEVPKIKVDSEGKLVPKSSDELKADEGTRKEKISKLEKEKDLAENAEDAEPEKPGYWELSRGDLINECNKRSIDVKGLGKKGVYVSKEQLINLLENDDQTR